MSASNKRSAEEISLLQGLHSTLESNLRSHGVAKNNSSDIDEDNIAESDPILFEAGQILGNQIGVISASNRLQIVQLEPNMATP